MTAITQPRQPRTPSWRFKTAGLVFLWTGIFYALFVTVFLAATNFGSRFDVLGIVTASADLTIAVGCFVASALTRNDPVNYGVVAADESADV